MTEVGARVIAVQSADRHQVRAFGYGTYAGHHERPGWDPDVPIYEGGQTLRQIAADVIQAPVPGLDPTPVGDQGEAIERLLARMSLNPRIDLDDGGQVWGCQCWWGPGGPAELEHYAAGREVVFVPAPGSKSA